MPAAAISRGLENIEEEDCVRVSTPSKQGFTSSDRLPGGLPCFKGEKCITIQQLEAK
jgi:hypothetical protein